MVNGRIVLAGALVVVAGCQPDFPDRSSAITGTRILGVRSEPAEAAPGGKVAYSALVVAPSGNRGDLPIDWAFCSEPHLLGDLNDVASSCFVLAADYLTPLGKAPAAGGAMPLDACRQFGPDVPVAQPGQPPGRPADPDATGGYYQPVRLILGDASAGYVLGAGETRIQCGLSSATREALADFKKRYRANENPTLADVVALGNPARSLPPDDGKTAGLEIGAGEVLHLQASWPECPATPVCGDGICSPDEDLKGCAADCKTPKGCAGAEPYVAFDLESRAVTTRREAMRVSWFATAGTFATDRSGRTEDDPAATTEDDWTAPTTAGPVHLWVVLRDSRGGIAWGSYLVQVK
jgi:hypothetical protein